MGKAIPHQGLKSGNPKPCHSTGYWLIGADYMGMMTQSQKHFDEVLK